jgi:hypothetical protein
VLLAERAASRGAVHLFDADHARAVGARPAAVCANSLFAGIIESSSGSATVAPRPLRAVRRERCLPVRMLMCASLFLAVVDRFSSCRAERRALRDAQNQI